MNRITHKLLFSGVFLGTLSVAFAQTPQRGAVQDQEFVIRKDRVLTLPTQPRSFERLPVLPQPKGMSDFRYNISSYFLSIPALKVQPTAVQKDYKQPKLNLYPGFVRVGYGNFASPLFDARYMSTSSDPLNFSLKLKHQSFGKGPVKIYEDSPESHSLVGGDFSYFLDKVEAFGGLSWGQDKYSFYGEDPNFIIDDRADYIGPIIETNAQNNLQFFAGIRDVEKVGPFGYEAKLGFRNFKDSFLANETELGIETLAKFRSSDEWAGKVGLSYFHTATEDLTYDLNRTFFAIRPEVSYKMDAFRFTVGLNIVSENDIIPDKESDFRIFPVLKASYQFAEEFGFFAAYSGDIQRNTYLSFVRENPFLGPSKQLLNTVNKFKLTGGIEGRFREAVHYRAGLDVSQFENLHFFVNSEADSAKFELVYDQRATVVNLNAELGIKLSEVYTLGSRLDLYQYDLSTQSDAWHRPVWALSINNQVKPIEKLLLQANLNFMGGIKARDNIQFDTNPPVIPSVELKTIADLQLKADFKVTNRISVFAEGNNLTNGKNTRWLNYPVRGVQLIGGASFKF